LIINAVAVDLLIACAGWNCEYPLAGGRSSGPWAGRYNWWTWPQGEACSTRGPGR